MTERGPTRTVLHVDFLTDTHRITCQVEPGPIGIVGTLNDTTSSLLLARNAYFSRLQQPTKIVANFEEIHLVKAHLALALLNRREDLGPQSYLRPSVGRILSAPVYLTTTMFEIRGTTEFTSRIDPDSLLIGGVGLNAARYTMLYNVTVIVTAYPDLPPFSAGALVFNRDFVTGMGVLTKGKA
ncbi:MAG: hypothetical protein RMK99_07785 [Anaerolineales bacterium]|nr:hypothetical protein [Anaerolineales bacterium]